MCSNWVSTVRCVKGVIRNKTSKIFSMRQPLTIVERVAKKRTSTSVQAGIRGVIHQQADRKISHITEKNTIGILIRETLNKLHHRPDIFFPGKHGRTFMASQTTFLNWLAF
mmetsp:Transcript_1557/g.3770  ORF Transcript_1557/g.3770 Transcript_1557/m.3770 type:complete len:111 (+) Transcript_1557:60-392(+)